MKKEWFKFIHNRAASEPCEVMIYGEIGTGWDGSSGVDAKLFAEEWRKIPAGQPINLRVHSPGGSVFDGLAIYNQIAQRKKDVTAYVEGVAISAASFIVMAAGKIVMPKTARMMIHDAQGFVIGDSQEMRDMAALLDRESDGIADIYASRTGKTRTEMRALMAKTTWMDGEEACMMGFADQVTNLDPKNCEFDLSAYRHVPDGLGTPTKTAVQNGGAQKGNDTMKKTEIVALLNKHGVTVANDATEETILAELNKLVVANKVTNEEANKLRATPPPATPVPAHVTTQPANVITTEQFNALQNQFNAERQKRITNEFDAIVRDNPSIDRAVWLPRAMQDETILNELRKLPGKIEDPSRPSVTNMGNPLIEKYRAMKPGPERQQFRVENQQALEQVTMSANTSEYQSAARVFGPRNANTLAAALTPDYLADGLIIVARNRLAPLTLFSRNFGVDPMKPKSTVQVPRATVGATAQTDATNWESGDTTLAATSVTVSQRSVSFHLTNDQLNKGHQMANLATINADQLCDAISDVWTALLTVGNFGTPGAGTGVIGAASAFDPADLPQIFALAKNFRSRNLLLDGSYIGYLMNGVSTLTAGVLGLNGGSSNQFGGLWGFDAIGMQNRWTGAVANTVGFVCGPDVLAVASGLPIATATPSNEFISQTVVNVDAANSNEANIGLSVAVNTWYSRATRTIWASYDVMFGAGLGDSSATLTLGQGRVLVSA